MFLAGSVWRKALATALTAGGIVALYEATAFDSKDTARDLTLETEPAPEPGARLRFTATAYCKGLTTAAGVAARAGVAAADPRLLPLGSVVEVDSPDSRYDGIYTILDTGPAVQGALLDIYMWSCHDALRFGRRPVRLTVLRLGWNPTATAPRFMDRLFKRLEQPVQPRQQPNLQPVSELGH
jgi:3D (Asp-Asp-Asp) domain-containing protein